MFLGEDRDGGYADFVVVDAGIILPVPDNVSLAAAAIATCTLGTAYHALMSRGQLRPGETVVVTGASGGVGLHAVSIAADAGARVVGIVSSEGRAEHVRKAGATDVIVTPTRCFAAEVRTLLGGQADLVIDIVGAPTLRESLHAVRPGGRVVVLGNVEGKEVSIPPAYLILKEISLVGTKSCTASEMRTLLQALSTGRFHADVSGCVPFAEGADIHRRMEAGTGNGRLVMEIAGE